MILQIKLITTILNNNTIINGKFYIIQKSLIT